MASTFEFETELFELPTWSNHIHSIRKLLPLQNDHPEVNISIILSLAASVEGYIKSVIVETERLFRINPTMIQGSELDIRLREDFISKVKRSNWSETIRNWELFFGQSLRMHVIPLGKMHSYHQLQPNEKNQLCNDHFTPLEKLFQLRNIVAHSQQIEMKSTLSVQMEEDNSSSASISLECSSHKGFIQFLIERKFLDANHEGMLQAKILFSNEIVDYFLKEVSKIFDVVTGRVFLLLKDVHDIDLRLIEMNAGLSIHFESMRLKRLLFSIDDCFDLSTKWDFEIP